MRAYVIWLAGIVPIGIILFRIFDEFGSLLFLPIIGGFGLFLYLRSRKKKPSFTSTKISLGRGKGSIVPINESR